MATFLMTILLAAIVWLMWMSYQTLDGFNEDLKQLRMLVGNIERKLSEVPSTSSSDTQDK